jgi:preprotein translocase subunit SecG
MAWQATRNAGGAATTAQDLGLMSKVPVAPPPATGNAAVPAAPAAPAAPASTVPQAPVQQAPASVEQAPAEQPAQTPKPATGG